MSEIKINMILGAQDVKANLDSVFEHVAIGLAVVDLAGKVMQINPALEHLLGYRMEALAGLSIKDVMQAGDEEEAQVLMQDLLAGRLDFYRLEKLCRRRDGEDIWLRATVSLLPAAEGRLAGTLHVIEDITDRKYFEQSVERLSREYEVILNTAGWGIIGTDKAGRINFVNPSAARMLGFDVEELLIRPVREVHHSAPDGSRYGEAECSIYRALRDGLSRQGAGDVLWRRNGMSFPIEYSITPILDDGRVQGVVIAFMDITEQLRFKHELEARIQNLTKFNQRLDTITSAR